ncbi:MAG: response regulator [Candidatus Marinimicrobia bacterium]|nr:response regulator [Candidatus Neomarinimicrobiota bacterium]
MRDLVLVVDDEQYIRMILQESLEMSGFEVLTARNGKEALDIYYENVPDIKLIITDISMPVMNGIEFRDRIQELFPETKIIALTGNYDFENAREDNLSDFTSVMTKPFNIPELMKSIVQHVNGNVYSS